MRFGWGFGWGLSAFGPRLGLCLVGGGHVIEHGPLPMKIGKTGILAAAVAVFGLQRQHCREALSVL